MKPCATCGETRPLTEFRRFRNSKHWDTCERCLGRDMRGQTYGRLLIVDRAPRGKKSESQWVCECACGKQHIAREFSLKQGNLKSCGCGLRDTNAHLRAPDGEVGFNKLLGSYKKTARSRNLSFLLTSDQFRALTQGDCHYCGAMPAAVSKQNAVRTAYVYNGVDRKDNAIGYEPHNVVSCCKICNLAKRTLSYDEFIAWIRRANTHLSVPTP